MDGNATSEGGTVDDHLFVRPNENTIIPSQLTANSPNGPLANLPSGFRYVPEDSCDSILSFDDQDEDDDEDPIDATGKGISSSQSSRLYQASLTGRIPKPQEPSAVEELQALIESVKETTNCKDGSENSPDGNGKEGSSMEVEYQRSSVPNLEMVEQPEESYRARYESEGCRGPVRGVSENGFPTVKVNGYVGNVVITVFLVTENGEPHLHSITGPGSTKTICKDVTLKDGTSGIQTWIGPEQNMTAVWDSLSVRRMRNWEANNKLRERGEDPAAWKNKKKEARLMFQCTIPQTSERLGYILTCQSRPFLCTAPCGNPEIWWMSESESSAKGGKEVAIIGKKFSTGFRVRFFNHNAEGLWDVLAEVDKGKSNQGAIVFKIPPYKNTSIEEPVGVSVEVRVGAEKDKRCSDSISFSYTPETTDDARKTSSCSKCNSIKDALSHLFANDSKKVKNEPYAEGSSTSLEPDRKKPSPAEYMAVNDSNRPMDVQSDMNIISHEQSQIIEEIKRLQSPSGAGVQVMEQGNQNVTPHDVPRAGHSTNQLKTSYREFTVPSQSVSISRTTALPVSSRSDEALRFVIQNPPVVPKVSSLPSQATSGALFPMQSPTLLPGNQPMSSGNFLAFSTPTNIQHGQKIRTLAPASADSAQQNTHVCVVDNQRFVRAYAPIAVQQGQPIQPRHSMQQVQHTQGVLSNQNIHPISIEQAIHSIQLQQKQALIQPHPTQHMPQVLGGQSYQQSSQIQLNTKSNLVHVRPAAPQLSKAAEYVVIPSSGYTNPLQQVHVKEEPTDKPSACAGPNASQSSYNTQATRHPVPMFNTLAVQTSLPVQQTFIHQNAGFGSQTAKQLVSQAPPIAGMPPQCVPSSDNILKQLLMIGHHSRLAGQSAPSNSSFSTTVMHSSLAPAPAQSKAPEGRTPTVNFGSSSYVLSSGVLVESSSRQPMPANSGTSQQMMHVSQPSFNSSHLSQYSLNSNQLLQHTLGSSHSMQNTPSQHIQASSINHQLMETSSAQRMQSNTIQQMQSNLSSYQPISASSSLGHAMMPTNLSSYQPIQPNVIPVQPMPSNISPSQPMQPNSNQPLHAHLSPGQQLKSDSDVGVVLPRYSMQSSMAQQPIDVRQIQLAASMTPSSNIQMIDPSQRMSHIDHNSQVTSAIRSGGSGMQTGQDNQSTPRSGMPSNSQEFGSSTVPQNIFFSQGIDSASSLQGTPSHVAGTTAAIQDTQSFGQIISSSSFVREAASQGQYIESPSLRPDINTFNQGMGSSSLTRDTQSLNQNIGSSSFAQQHMSLSQGISNTTFTQETPSASQGIGSSSFAQMSPEFNPAMGSSCSSLSQNSQSYSQYISSSSLGQQNLSYSQGLSNTPFIQDNPVLRQGVGTSSFTQGTPTCNPGSSSISEEMPSFSQGIGSSSFMQQNQSFSQSMCNTSFDHSLSNSEGMRNISVMQETQSFSHSNASSSFTPCNSLSQSTSAFIQEAPVHSQGISSSSLSQENRQNIVSSFTQENPFDQAMVNTPIAQDIDVQNQASSTGQSIDNRTFIEATPSGLTEQSGLAQQLNDNFQSPGSQLFSRDGSGQSSRRDSTDMSNTSYDQVGSNQALYQLTPDDVTSNTEEAPQTTHMESEESWMADSLSQNSNTSLQQNSEPAKVLSSALAQDLDRLSVESSYLQARNMQSEPVNIPSNRSEFAVHPESSTPVLGDPQPMSLTEDPIPEELLNKLVKEHRERQARIKLNPSVEETETDRAQHVSGTGNILLESEQHLADSFLVPQKVDDLNQIEQQLQQKNADQLIQQYIGHLDRLKNLEQPGTAQYTSEFINKPVDEGSSEINQVQPSNEAFSNNSYQQTCDDTHENIGRNPIDENNIASATNQSNPVGDLHASTPATWNTDSLPPSNDSNQTESNTGWNTNPNSNITSPLQSDQTNQSPSIPSVSSNVQNFVYISDVSGSSMDVTEAFDSRNVSSEELQFQQNIPSAEAFRFQPQFQNESVSTMQISQQQQQQFEQNSAESTHQQLYQENSTQSLNSSDGGGEIQVIQKIPLTFAESDQSDWNELVGDTRKLLEEGLVNQQEAQTIYSCVQQEDNLLLEMYRTAKKGTEDTGKVIETLKHWVLNVKHVGS